VSKLIFRRAKKEDCELIYKWANDPEVRKNSFSGAAITVENHQKWFESKLADSKYSCTLFQTTMLMWDK
jgi:hypothetical protein